MKQNPRRRHIKNQGDLNLAVQTKSIGNWVYSIFNEQKQENLFLDNLEKTVPIPCIFFVAAFKLFLWYLGLQKNTLLRSFLMAVGFLQGSGNSPWINNKIFPDLPFPDTTIVCKAVTNSAINLFYVLYGFLQIFKWFEIYLCLSQYYAHLCVASRCRVLAICY